MRTFKESLIDDAYLGDGVYASFDGYSVWLDLRGLDSTTKIAMEPYVMVALDHFRDAIHKKYSEPPDAGVIPSTGPTPGHEEDCTCTSCS